MEGFLCQGLGGLIFGGAYFQNFTVIMKDFLNNSTCKSPPSLKIFLQASLIIFQLFKVGSKSNISNMRHSVSSSK